ncbi:hypothetical protein [Neobacillus endophyticus]|uniref:hypothetical protein n=1 Tax=Neobacillus endophyticus TaxID=2738405 RepID=UPI001C25F3BC|nr:hypothetical protein [Neobacillus endophyticus]
MAEVNRLGVSIGLLTIEEVIKWADNLIEHIDTPPYEIIELSLSAKEKLEVINLKLMNVKGEFDYDLPPKIILGLLNQYINTTEDMSSVIEKMDKLIEYLPVSCEWIEKEIHYISDGYYLAEQNIYGELKEMLINLKRFLNQFKSVLIFFN